MNRNYLIAFGVTVAVLGLLAFAAWMLFEIEPRTRRVSPSREARKNEYLALDRWLEGRGISARTQNSGDLSTIYQAAEKHIFVQASLFNWNDQAIEYLTDWVGKGGHLFLVLDYNTMWDDETFTLLENFGITAETGEGTEISWHDFVSPNFDRKFYFLPSRDLSERLIEKDDAGIMFVKDWTNFNRLAQVKYGEGTFTVSGRPRYLHSSNLDNTHNARIAWAIFAETGAEKSGWLFIRGASRVRGLFGSLWRHGNLSVLIVSTLVLLVICFWAVLPMFGLVKEDDEKPGKALRERFLAEGRFLKRYNALDLYLETYIKEIKRILARKEGIVDNNDIENRVLEIWGKPKEKSALLLLALRGEYISYSEFPKMVIIFKTILEKI